MYIVRTEKDLVIISIKGEGYTCDIECSFDKWVDYVHKTEQDKIYDICEDGGNFIDYMEMFKQMSYDMYKTESFINWILGLSSKSSTHHFQTKKVEVANP